MFSFSLFGVDINKGSQSIWIGTFRDKNFKQHSLFSFYHYKGDFSVDLLYGIKITNC